MKGPASSRRLPAVAAALGSAFVVWGQAFPLSPLVDAVEGGPFHDAALAYPAGYILLAPFSAFADLLTFSSKTQAIAWLCWLLGAYWLAAPLRAPRSPLRAALGFAGHVLVVVAFLAWAFLAPRPMARLTLSDPELLALDLHSHSACSHDGRRSFTGAANARWHLDAGFDAWFLTDHNKEACSRVEAEKDGSRSLTGVELSLHGAHVVALSPHSVVPPERYQNGPAGLTAFLREAWPVWGARPVLSLPEYWKHHWAELDSLAEGMWGEGGLEVANGAPKALMFPPELRAEAVALARRRGLFLACATDNHGWSRAAYCWNVAALEGWGALPRPELEAALTRRMHGPDALRIAARRRVETSPGWRAALDPVVGLSVLVRTLSPAAAALTLFWLWVLCGVRRALPWGASRRGLPSV
ncbi:hypothetical protein EPO15_10115 [bacterium]|nr:MAG: hypothetical protein EPO15_10115 [bacterium]